MKFEILIITLIVQSIVALPMNIFSGCCARKADDVGSEATKVATSTGASNEPPMVCDMLSCRREKPPPKREEIEKKGSEITEGQSVTSSRLS